jgi:flagellar basal body-associated protein FliL
MDERIEPTRNDPTPAARTGDSRFLPVVVIAVIALIVILTAAILLIKGRGHKIVPHNQTEQPISRLVTTAPALEMIGVCTAAL